MKPRVLICMPCYGGQLYYTTAGSLFEIGQWAMREGVQVAIQFIANESLIPRGRDRCADMFVRSGYEKLLFIDSDISFRMQDFLKLYESDKKVVGGTYPAKAYPIQLMMNALTEHGHIMDHKTRTALELEALGKKFGNERGEVEVRHIPTGFMMIDRSVFEALKPHTERYWTLELGTQKEIEVYNYFGSGPLDGQYLSEDWWFCHQVRKHLDCGVWLNTKVVTQHTGTHTFKAGHT